MKGDRDRKTHRLCVVLILDGLGDQPIPVLGQQTPLEAAQTPRLDRLASAGRCGLVDPIAPGVVPNTHTGVGILFGLRPRQRELLKRGPVEAAGAGLHLDPGDVAFRANLATLERVGDGLRVRDRRAGRVIKDAPEFAKAIEEVVLGNGVTARFRTTDQHRGALVFSGPGLSAALSDTDPGDGSMPTALRPCQPLHPGSAATAKLVNQYVQAAHEILAGHPLNSKREADGKLPVTGVITRGAGAWFDLDSVLDERQIPAALVVGCNTVAGLGRVFGLHIVRQSGFTADASTDLEAKLKAARDTLSDFPLVYVHIKATDLFSHDFQPEGKRDFIERLDRALVVLEGAGAAIALASDHTTDSNKGAHTADPVPVLLCASGTSDARDGGNAPNFGETACRTGSLGRLDGHGFLLEILRYLDS